MNGTGAIRLRLDLQMESLSIAVQQWSIDHSNELQDIVNAELDRLSSEGVIERLITEAIHREVQESLGKEVKHAVQKAVWNDDTRAALGRAIGGAIASRREP